MIDLDKYYKNISEYELIEIIESYNEYKPEVIEYCKKRINELNLQHETLKGFATEIIEKRFYKYFADGEYKLNTPVLMDSFFLNNKEVRNCFKESKAKYMTLIDAMTNNLM